MLPARAAEQVGRPRGRQACGLASIALPPACAAAGGSPAATAGGRRPLTLVELQPCAEMATTWRRPSHFCARSRSRLKAITAGQGRGSISKPCQCALAQPYSAAGGNKPRAGGRRAGPMGSPLRRQAGVAHPAPHRKRHGSRPSAPPSRRLCRPWGRAGHPTRMSPRCTGLLTGGQAGGADGWAQSQEGRAQVSAAQAAGRRQLGRRRSAGSGGAPALCTRAVQRPPKWEATASNRASAAPGWVRSPPTVSTCTPCVARSSAAAASAAAASLLYPSTWGEWDSGSRARG